MKPSVEQDLNAFTITPDYYTRRRIRLAAGEEAIVAKFDCEGAGSANSQDEFASVITYSKYAQMLNWDVLYIATGTATVIHSLSIEWSRSV